MVIFLLFCASTMCAAQEDVEGVAVSRMRNVKDTSVPYSYLTQEEKKELLCYLKKGAEGVSPDVSNLDQELLSVAHTLCGMLLEEQNDEQEFKVAITEGFQVAPPCCDVDFSDNQILFISQRSKNMIAFFITTKDEETLMDRGLLQKILFPFRSRKSKEKKRELAI